MLRSLGTVVAFVSMSVFAGGSGCSGRLSGGRFSVEGVGDPCALSVEGTADYGGASVAEVTIEYGTLQCETRVCLANHFQGVRSCPYGRYADGVGPIGGAACTTGADARAEILPQCVARPVDKALYCSCRCANLNGQTDDGETYCACPDNFECTYLVGAIGESDKPQAGSYCIKRGTEYRKGDACVECDARKRDCDGR